MLAYIEHLCEEELKGLDKISQDKRHLRDDLDKCLAENIRRRQQNAEQDKILTERVKQQQQDADVSIYI